MCHSIDNTCPEHGTNPTHISHGSCAEILGSLESRGYIDRPRRYRQSQDYLLTYSFHNSGYWSQRSPPSSANSFSYFDMNSFSVPQQCQGMRSQSPCSYYTGLSPIEDRFQYPVVPPFFSGYTDSPLHESRFVFSNKDLEDRTFSLELPNDILFDEIPDIPCNAFSTYDYPIPEQNSSKTNFLWIPTPDVKSPPLESAQPESIGVSPLLTPQSSPPSSSPPPFTPRICLSSDSCSIASPEPVQENPAFQSLATFHIPAPRLNTPIIIKGSSEYPEIQRTIEKARDECSKENYGEKLQILEALCRKFPTCYVCWLEWSRVENIYGDFKRSSLILKEGIEYLPENETLLEKILKAYERLWYPDEVKRYTLQLLSIGSQRGLRSGVEGIIMLARMGRRRAANLLFCEVISTREVEPALHVDFLRYLFRNDSIDEGNRILDMLLAVIPQHAPIWFLKLQEDGRLAMLCWKEGNVAERLQVEPWLSFYSLVKENITSELLWKITSNIAQTILHAYTHVRFWLNRHLSVHFRRWSKA